MSGDNHPPYIPLYVNDFYSSGKVTSMTAAAVGAYILLLCQAWSEKPPASIPNNDVVLSRWARMNSVEWAENKAMVLAAFTLGKDNRWHQKRLRFEYDKFRKRSADKSKAGRIGAKKRWKDDDITKSETTNNITEPCDCHADAITDQCLSSSSSFSIPPIPIGIFPPRGTPPTDKIRFGKHVLLTAMERQTFGEMIGESAAERLIERMNLWADQIGAKNFRKRINGSGHYAALVRWAQNDGFEHQDKKNTEIPEKKEENEQKNTVEEYRRTLKKKTKIQERFLETVINPLREKISESSWETFIKPLLVVSVSSTEIVLFAEEWQRIWLVDNYLDRIKEKLKDPGMEVKITSEVE